MKKIIFYFTFLISILINAFYINYLVEQKKHKDEFFSLFKVNKTSYNDGFIQLKEKLNNKKPFHLIHIWDTVYLEFGDKIPYTLSIDSLFKKHSFKKIDCTLMSSMSDETIGICLKSRNIHFSNLVVINEMEDYISGVCNHYGRKSKPTAATLLINQNGGILYYTDKIKYTLDKDTQLLKILDSLK